MAIRATGVFGKKELKELIGKGRLIPKKGFITEKDVSPASVDITVLDDVYRLENLFHPSALEKEKIRNLLPFMRARKIGLGDILEPGCTYIGPANLGVNFPPNLYGYLNAKSSSGRNFLFSRTIADEMHMFDAADKRNVGYSGQMWLVLQPLAFPTILTSKERYSQLRVFNGDTRFKQADLDDLLLKHDILYRREDKKPYKQSELSLFTHDGSVLCTLHAPAGKLVGYRAKKTMRPLDLEARGIDPTEYFEPVYAERIKVGRKWIDFVRIQGGYYYLLSTSEMIKVPTTHSAELVALDTRLGFFFTHFAGFFDPGFFGTGTLEVYSPHDIVLRHKQPVARFVFERLLSDTVSYQKHGNYFEQIETQLPKQFTKWKE
jgi:deoxycytidine triphosphate deaminase